ncbi:hypothetical protein ACOSP7_018120 [Xanthoceras sorbifolium]|uniref:Pectate lyase n=1 Tax=Xanthoceras sorbifolium TaxID=99658 RepID=A0ABQ8I0K3_9ROSI|nr:hypothetical protein JRO89_XS05G0058900 [Xanthoceras sorbifolium]
MATLNKRFFQVLFFFMAFAVLLPALHAEDGPEMDEYWKKRAEIAFEKAQNAYNPNPEEVTESVNQKVGKFMTGFINKVQHNTTRRQLMKKKYKGPCMATNPIDQCWRCDPNWGKYRKRLADCAIGFGRNTIGGKKGRFYIVNDTSDDIVNPKPGTLRYGVIQKKPLWIVFARSMIIRLKEELMVTCDKTIDGRGSNVHIAYGAGITLQYVQNVIIHNIHVHDIVAGEGGMIRDSVDHVGFRTPSDGDGISMFGASNIWIDHVSMYRCGDGLIDAIMGSTGVTISNSHFTNHNEVMLFGANDKHNQDKLMQITVAFNHFGKGLVQRMPRCRHGFFHVVNNDYTHWLMYAIGGSMNPTIISQGNRFIAPPNGNAKEVTKRENYPESEWRHWTWRSEGDLMMNGAFFVQSGNPNFDSKSKEGMITAKPGHMVTSITRFAGTLRCKKGYSC